MAFNAIRTLVDTNDGSPGHKAALKQSIGEAKMTVNGFGVETIGMVREFCEWQSQSYFITQEPWSRFIVDIKAIYSGKCAIFRPEDRIGACGGQKNYDWIGAQCDETAREKFSNRWHKKDTILFYPTGSSISGSIRTRTRSVSCITANVSSDTTSVIQTEAGKYSNDYLPNYRIVRYDVGTGKITMYY
jgi:hypothetical protein